MLDIYIAIFGLYIFALGGFILKKILKNELDNKSLTQINVYIFQPILGFWGFTKAPMQLEVLGAGLHHLLTVSLVMFLLFGLAKIFIKDRKIRILSSFTGTSGNTGNIGIPLAAIIFGPIGVVTATMINFFNILWNVFFGVYFYSRGQFSIKKSIQNVLTMPLLWGGILGIMCNLSGVYFTGIFEEILNMGAHASIALQLLLLGVFIASIQLRKLDIQLSSFISFVKFGLVPAIGMAFLLLIQHFFVFENTIIIQVMLLQLFVPLAVNNANLATLYNCYPEKVSESILVSYIIFTLFYPVVHMLYL